MNEMTNTVSQVGTGVFVIVLVWIAALVLAIILLRAAGSAKLGVIPIVLLALTITLVLVFFPRSPENRLPFTEIEQHRTNTPHVASGRASKPSGFAKQAATPSK
ncbi:hypothetical protein ILYODFUR_006265 [Ilyodon furcidens]|uniref:Transmembrane protein 218 n=1 Tax=Ilyodon furcidens TaxID=33524 RepID=A0ABV0TGF1_9TELE